MIVEKNIQDEVIIAVDILNQVGSGGFGTVYRALEKHTQREIVLKKVEKTNFNQNFFEEASILYKNRHPNIVEMTYAGESSCKKFWYLAMPYYSNGCLNKKINQGNLSVNEILSLSLNFLSGLNCIHQNGMIHGDIKPQNILISDRNEAVIADFGISVTLDSNGFTSLKGMTSIICPPENLYGNHIGSVATDIYHAGIVLFSLVNGIDFEKHVFSVLPVYENQEDLFKIIESGGLFNKNTQPCPVNIPTKLYDLVYKCVSKDISKRPVSIQKMLNVLSEIDC